jgi:hypothetical protein
VQCGREEWTRQRRITPDNLRQAAQPIRGEFEGRKSSFRDKPLGCHREVTGYLKCFRTKLALFNIHGHPAVQMLFNQYLKLYSFADLGMSTGWLQMLVRLSRNTYVHGSGLPSAPPVPQGSWLIQLIVHQVSGLTSFDNFYMPGGNQQRLYFDDRLRVGAWACPTRESWANGQWKYNHIV